MKESKRSYFTNYIQNSLNYLMSTWKGMKNLGSLKELPNVAPFNIFDNGQSLTEPQEMMILTMILTNILLTLLQTFNRLFSSPNFHDIFPTININSFFLNHIEEIEVKNIILSLNPSKAIGPKSIPTKILSLLINDISSQLTKFLTFIFPVVFSH